MMNLGTVPRVDGELAMTNGKLKDHITSEPNIKVKKIDNETDFIILEIDGL